MLTKGDKFLIGIVLLAALMGIAGSWWYLPQQPAQQAEIYVDGALVKTIVLREGYYETLRIGGDTHYNLVEVDGTRVRIREADCPDQLCVRSSWASVVPQQIVCLPYRVVVKIVSTGTQDVDGVIR